MHVLKNFLSALAQYHQLNLKNMLFLFSLKKKLPTLFHWHHTGLQGYSFNYEKFSKYQTANIISGQWYVTASKGVIPIRWIPGTSDFTEASMWFKKSLLLFILYNLMFYEFSMYSLQLRPYHILSFIIEYLDISHKILWSPLLLNPPMHVAHNYGLIPSKITEKNPICIVQIVTGKWSNSRWPAP